MLAQGKRTVPRAKVPSANIPHRGFCLIRRITTKHISNGNKELAIRAVQLCKVTANASNGYADGAKPATCVMRIHPALFFDR